MSSRTIGAALAVALRFGYVGGTIVYVDTTHGGITTSLASFKAT